jgi:hypothetical protein
MGGVHNILASEEYIVLVLGNRTLMMMRSLARLLKINCTEEAAYITQAVVNNLHIYISFTYHSWRACSSTALC